jgi:hypothetical protein
MSFGGPFLLAPLSSLLGIRSGMHVRVVQPVEGFLERLLPLPEGAALLESSSLGLDVTVFFTHKKVDLVARLPELARGMSVTGGVWVVFPAQAEGPAVPTEDFVRLAALEMGLTDTKKVLLDPAWVALRLQSRPGPRRLDLPQATA